MLDALVMGNIMLVFKKKNAKSRKKRVLSISLNTEERG